MTARKPFNYLSAQLMRWWGNRIAPHGKGQGRLCVINYHRIVEYPDPLLESEPDVKSFRWQMELLADCFNVLPLHDAVHALADERMPPRAVSITFDDGYRSVHDFALPILKELGLPATVFVATRYMHGGRMWNDTILEAIRRLPAGNLDLRGTGLGLHPLTSLQDRKHTINALTGSAKYLAPDARQAVAQKLAGLVSQDLPPGEMLTPDEIVTLARNGVEIGGHTINHPILTCLADDIAMQEIAGCKQELESIIGRPVRLFAYPNGKFGMDYDERHVQMVKDAGYAAAFSTALGAATGQHDRFELPRSRPWGSTQLMYGVHLLRWLAGVGK